MRTILKTKDLPLDIQVLLKETCDFHKLEVKVEPTIDFTCPGNWNDFNIQRMFVYNQTTGESKGITSGNYECHLSWTEQEKAMYLGKLKTSIPDPSIWIIVTDTHPKGCTIYCHPDAISKQLEGPKLELPRRQQIVLYITRSLVSSARLEEARRFRFTMSEWNTCKAELFNLGLLRSNGSLTTEGKNLAQRLNFNTWEEIV